MNYAVIFAGGVGKRMNTKDRPKQFLEVNGKPILVHTVEHFERHPEIDGICVVCLEEWIDYCKALFCRFNIKKVRWIVSGGETAIKSQYNGLRAICSSIDVTADDIVLIHDGVRPLINFDVISNCINGVREFGSAIVVAPAIETIAIENSEGYISRVIPRSDCVLARAPQCFYLENIWSAHVEARRNNDDSYIDSVSLMLAYGHRVHTVLGPMENIKVTTPSDYYICSGLLDAKKAEQKKEC